MKKVESMPRQILALFLKQAREGAGLTQKQVAEHLGYSTAQFISSWERGEREPPMNAIWHLAALYKVSAEKIFETMLAYRTQTLSLQLRADFNAGRPKSKRG